MGPRTSRPVLQPDPACRGADITAATAGLAVAGLQVRVWDETYGKQGVVTTPEGLTIATRTSAWSTNASVNAMPVAPAPPLDSHVPQSPSQINQTEPAERSDVIGTSQTAASHRGQPRRYASTADTRRSLPGSRSSLAKMLPTCLRTAASLTKSRCAIEPFVRP